MDIISFRFALLTIGACLVFYLLNAKYRIIYLVTLSYAFIASLSIGLLIYIILYAFINYITGLRINDSKHRTILFRAGIIFNLAQLLLLKYVPLATGPLSDILTGSFILSRLTEIIIPVGISYFTLQGIGYLINVKMGWEKPERIFPHFLLYIVFFPKFLSGPIERSNHFLPQLKTNVIFNEQNVSEGLRIALFGFFKKVAIANQLAPFVSGSYTSLNSADGLTLWILILVQPLYLYFDFSGYTDIAIGFSRTFGINLLPNFNRPFFSENMTTFWKRFHISLSSWFNDYIFRQASFRYRRWGVNASVLALLLTWVLFGIWHGSGWTFMLLGLVQASAIIYEFFTKKWRIRLFSVLPDYPRIVIGRTATYLFYGISLVFFFAPDLNSVKTLFSNLFRTDLTISSLYAVLQNVHREISYATVIFIFVFMLIEFLKNDFESLFKRLEPLWSGYYWQNRMLRWLTYYFMIFTVYVLNRDVQQFIYFQF